MPQIRYDGTVYDFVRRPTFGEIDMIEHQAKRAFEAMSETLQTAASILLTLRRNGIVVTWDDVMVMSPDDFEFIEDPAPETEGEPADPQPAGAEAGEAAPVEAAVAAPPSPSSETGTGS